MNCERASRIEAPLAHGLVLLAAVLWIELRLRLLAHGINLLLPYALLVLFAAAAAYTCDHLRRRHAPPRLAVAWLVLMPIVIFVSACMLTTVVYLGAAHLITGRLGALGYREELLWVVPAWVFLGAWPVLVTGLPAATAWSMRGPRLHRG